LRLLEQSPVDVILCDLFMPGKEGLETIRELRGTSRVPIIAMTGDGPAYGQDLLGMARKFGAASTLIKPFDTETLLWAIQEVLTLPGRDGEAAVETRGETGTSEAGRIRKNAASEGPGVPRPPAWEGFNG
jgi:DNA-binding response OmpR family regulator